MSALLSTDCAGAQEQANGKRGYGNTESDVPVDALELVDPRRNAWLPPEVVIETLRIRPGMKILDIGAGPGVFTFLMANELKNTGHIYATEISPSFVDYINKKAREKGYNNITAVLVQRDASDPIYKNAFDIILCCESLGGILDIRQYFSDLKSSLVKKTGRLYIITLKRVSNFKKEDFDFRQLVSYLSSKSSDFPAMRRLHPAVRDFIREYKTESVPYDIQNKILDGLNATLSDRRLIFDFVTYYMKNKTIDSPNKDWMLYLLKGTFNEQSEYYKLLFTNLDESGVFDDKNRPLTHLELEQLQMLNKRLLSNGLPMTEVRFTQGYDNPLATFPGKNSILSKIKAAGYRLVKDHDNLSQCYFLEFARND